MQAANRTAHVRVPRKSTKGQCVLITRRSLLDVSLTPKSYEITHGTTPEHLKKIPEPAYEVPDRFGENQTNWIYLIIVLIFPKTCQTHNRKNPGKRRRAFMRVPGVRCSTSLLAISANRLARRWLRVNKTTGRRFAATTCCFCWGGVLLSDLRQLLL